MTIRADIVADSISLQGHRITTFALYYPFNVHAQLMTHRVFSRNAASSRAIPSRKIIENVRRDPAEPSHWGANQKGMQAYDELTGWRLSWCKFWWRAARNFELLAVRALTWGGLHKQQANRRLQCDNHITVIVTATDWDNFFRLRCADDTQHEMQQLATMMLAKYRGNIPMVIEAGDWHLPFVSNEEWKEHPIDLLKKASAARCARVSYLTHDRRNPLITDDVALHDRLLLSGHMSPFEHQASPSWGQFANFRNWASYRYCLELLDRQENVPHESHM